MDLALGDMQVDVFESLDCSGTVVGLACASVSLAILDNKGLGNIVESYHEGHRRGGAEAGGADRAGEGGPSFWMRIHDGHNLLAALRVATPVKVATARAPAIRGQIGAIRMVRESVGPAWAQVNIFGAWCQL